MHAPAGEFPPFVTIDGDLSSGLLIICDHASNAMPAEYGTLGLPQSQLERHIGYDIGVAPLTRLLAERLGVPAVLTTFSRLFIDPNRGEDDPTLLMRLSDGAIIPGNARVDEAEREKRLAGFYRPYHNTVSATIDAMMAAGRPPAIFSIHSFTANWRGWPRPWHAGVLWDRDPRMNIPLIEALRRDPELVVGDNEPYVGALKNDTMYKHGTSRGLAHSLLEVRQDLIGHEAGIVEWADRLAPILEELMQLGDINTIQHHGSSTD